MYYSSNPAARPNATAALLADPQANNRELARRAGCAESTINVVRRELELAGQIPRILPWERRRRPAYDDQAASRAALAIKAGASTIEQVMEQASVTRHCAHAALRESRPQHARPPVRASAPPAPDLPPAPDWTGSPCTASPPAVRRWWTSDDPDERAAAILACQRCPVLGQCAEWSLHLPAVQADTAVYGAMTPSKRQRLATERRRPPARMSA